jgi:hypothetical protein
MYHRMVTAKLGTSDAVATTLRNAARSAELRDARFPNISPESILDKWSDIIMEDYKARNPDIAEATPNIVSIATVQNQQTAMMIQMQASLSRMESAQDGYIQRFATNEQTESGLHDRVAALEGQLYNARQKLACIKTPPGATLLESTALTRQSEAAENIEGTNRGSKSRRLNDSQDASTGRWEAAPSLEVAPPALVAARQRRAPAVPPRKLVYGAEARAAEKSSDANQFVSVVLRSLHTKGLLNATNFGNVNLPQGEYTQKQSMLNTLELVEVVISDEERKVVKSHSAAAADLEVIWKNVEKKCMDQMLEYEGGSPEVEVQIRTRKRATYLAIGPRVRDHKKALAVLTGNTEYNSEKLRVLPKAPEGTPPGVTGIRSFFATKPRPGNV